MFYAEERRGDTWFPVMFADRPDVKKGRVVRAGGVGPLVRNIKEVDAAHASLPLLELQWIYGHKSEDNSLC